MDKFTPEQLIALDIGGNARAAVDLIQKPVDYSSRQAVKYSEALKTRVEQALKDGPKDATDSSNQAGISGSFVYSATGTANAKPAWAK